MGLAIPAGLSPGFLQGFSPDFVRPGLQNCRPGRSYCPDQPSNDLAGRSPDRPSTTLQADLTARIDLLSTLQADLPVQIDLPTTFPADLTVRIDLLTTLHVALRSRTSL